MSSEFIELCPRHRLYDPMNVNWLATCVRPKTHIDLIGLKQRSYHRGGVTDGASQTRRFDVGQICNVQHVTSWFDDQRANPERADTVLDSDVLTVKDASAWRLPPSLSQVASKATLHGAATLAADWSGDIPEHSFMQG